jgi:hypothetical protein
MCYLPTFSSCDKIITLISAFSYWLAKAQSYFCAENVQACSLVCDVDQLLTVSFAIKRDSRSEFYTFLCSVGFELN